MFDGAADLGDPHSFGLGEVNGWRGQLGNVHLARHERVGACLRVLNDAEDDLAVRVFRGVGALVVLLQDVLVALHRGPGVQGVRPGAIRLGREACRVRGPGLAHDHAQRGGQVLLEARLCLGESQGHLGGADDVHGRHFLRAALGDGGVCRECGIRAAVEVGLHECGVECGAVRKRHALLESQGQHGVVGVVAESGGEARTNGTVRLESHEVVVEAFEELPLCVRYTQRVKTERGAVTFDADGQGALVNG